MTEQEEFEFRDRLEREQASTRTIDRTAPEYQGGALSPANIQAQQDLKQAQQNASPLGFIQQHPFLSMLQGAPALLTGTTAEQRVMQNSPKTSFTPQQIAEYQKNWHMTPSAVDQMPPQNQFALMGARVLDMISPANALINPTAKMIAAPIDAGIGVAGNFVKGLINGPEQAYQASQIAKTTIAQKAAEDIANTQRIGGIKLDLAQENANTIKQGYEGLTDALKKQVSQYSDAEAKQLQSDLPKIFAKKSQEYGSKLKDIIESLPATRNSVPAENIVQGMEDSLVNHGVMRYTPEGQLIQARTNLSSTEQKILDLYSSTKEQLTNNPGSKIDIQDLMKNQKFLSPKFGKAWTPDDRLSASVAENISNHITDTVPEIKRLRQDYAPFLEWKKQIIKDTNPFGGQFDTQKASSLLSKVGTPARVNQSGALRPDEARLVSQLENVIGRQVGNGRIAALNKGIMQTGDNAINANQAARKAVDNLKANIANDIENIKQNQNLSMQQIDEATSKLVNKYKNQRILVGAGLGGVSLATGGKLLEYFVRREAYSGLHSRY